MTLSFEEYLQGSFALIFAIFASIITIILISKYFKHKLVEFMLVGIAFFGLVCPWLAVAISFLDFIIFNTTLNEETFFIINLGIVPFTAICWVTGIAKLMSVKKQIVKLIWITGIIVAIVFEIIFLNMLFTDTTLIGTFTGTLQVTFSLFSSIFILIITGLFEIPGLLFVRESLRSEKSEIKMKGKILLIAFLSVVFGTFIEALIPIIIINVIGRIILILGGITFYVGFTLPNWAKKFLLKNN